VEPVPEVGGEVGVEKEVNPSRGPWLDPKTHTGIQISEAAHAYGDRPA
jgi:hypothetical protein